MSIIRPIVTGIVTLILFSCGSPENAAQEEASKAEAAYFPVNDYISSQIKKVDSLQLPVTRYYSGSDSKDTVALSLEDFRAQATPFLQEDISLEPLKSKYQESSFADQSIPSITFTYHTKDSSLPIKRVDVVLKPDPVMTDQVKSVYIEKVYQKGDTLVNEKLFWKADHYYQVIQTRQVKENHPTMSQLKVVWDPTE